MSRKISINGTTSFEQVRQFLLSSTDAERQYTLRASKKRKTDAMGKQRSCYTLFIRDGSEGIGERFINFVFQEKQRKLAREALAFAFAGAAYGDERNKLDFGVAMNDMKRLAPGDDLNELLNNARIGDEQAASQRPPENTNTERASSRQGAVLDLPGDSIDLRHDHTMTIVTAPASPTRTPPTKTDPIAKKGKSKSFSVLQCFDWIPVFTKGSAAVPKSAHQLTQDILRSKAASNMRKKTAAATSRIEVEPSGIHKPTPIASISELKVMQTKNLDVSDLHPSVCVAMQDSEDYFNMTDSCRTWLRRRLDIRAVSAEKLANRGVSRVDADGKSAYLATHIANSENQPVDEQSVTALAAIYRSIVEDAIRNNKPLVLTPLFHYERKSIKRLLTAMLAPLYEQLQAGNRPRVEIRVSCPKIAAALEEYKRRNPCSPMSKAGKALPQMKGQLDMADLAADGMIMLTPETISLAREDAATILISASERFHDTTNEDRAQMRKALERKASKRWYYFGGDSPAQQRLKGSDVARINQEIEAQYRAAFLSAQEHRCRFLTLPALESRYGTALSSEAAAMQVIGILARLRTEFPKIGICLLTRNRHVSKHFDLLRQPIRTA